MNYFRTLNQIQDKVKKLGGLCTSGTRCQHALSPTKRGSPSYLPVCRDLTKKAPSLLRDLAWPAASLHRKTQLVPWSFELTALGRHVLWQRAHSYPGLEKGPTQHKHLVVTQKFQTGLKSFYSSSKNSSLSHDSWASHLTQQE